MNQIPSLYFDESGHTGENLLDENQPIFTLASVKLESGQADELLSVLPPSQGVEHKASSLTRSDRGRAGLIRLLEKAIFKV